jgi:hypothetical protein
MSKSLTSSAHGRTGWIAELASATAALEASPSPTTAIVSAVNAEQTLPRQDDLRVVMRRIVVAPSRLARSWASGRSGPAQPGLTDPSTSDGQIDT